MGFHHHLPGLKVHFKGYSTSKYETGTLVLHQSLPQSPHFFTPFYVMFAWQKKYNMGQAVRAFYIIVYEILLKFTTVHLRENKNIHFWRVSF